MTAAAAPAPAAPPRPQGGGSSKRLSDKTLKEREFRTDKLVAWLGALLLLVAVVGLWGLSRFVVDAPEIGRRPGGGTPVGLVLGGLSVVLYALVAAYSWRHRRRAQKRAMTRTWMEVHLAFGLVSGVAALLHAGPRLGAPVHGAFLIAFLLLIGTGVLGKFLSVVIPRRLTRIEDEALLVEDVVERQKAMRTEIEQLLQDADDKLVHIVNNVIPPKIKPPDWYGRRRMRRPAVVDAVYAAVKGDTLVPEDKREWLRRIITCLVEDEFLGRMLTYHYLLRAWVPLHIALTTLCFPWLLFHLIAVTLL